MKLSKVLAVDPSQAADSKVVVVVPIDPRTCCRVLGSSVRTTVKPGEKREGAIPLDLSGITDKDRGVIAMVIEWQEDKGGGRSWSQKFGAIIGIDSAGIQLDRAFVCSLDRMSEISNTGSFDHALRVIAKPTDGEEIIFTTQPNVPGTSCVDGNLLCRFLVDKAELAELQAAAQECAAEKSAREQLEEVRQILEEGMGGNDPGHDLAECVKAHLGTLRGQFGKRIDSLGEEALRRQVRVTELENQLKQATPWETAARDLLRALGPWTACLRSKVVRKAMATVQNLIDAAAQK